MRLPIFCLLYFATLRPALGQTAEMEVLSDQTARRFSLERSLLDDAVQTFTYQLRGGQQNDPFPEALPELARSLLLDLYQTPADRPMSVQRGVDRLRSLQDTATRANQLDEAAAIRDSLREFLARKDGAQPDPGNLAGFRGQNGKKFTFFVTGRKQGTVWGSGVYTDDSALASVVVHAGLLAEGESGIVRVTIRPGQEQYEGSERNGVQSNSYQNYQGSYTVERVRKVEREPAAENPLPKEAMDILTDLERHEQDADFKTRLKQGIKSLRGMQRSSARAGRLDEALALRDVGIELLALLLGAKPAPANFTEFRGQVGQTAHYIIKGRTRGSLWGSGAYTDDSDPGVVAVHAGLLRPGQKGVLKVTLLPGYASYTGSLSNGVTSQSYNAWHGSYKLELADF